MVLNQKENDVSFLYLVFSRYVPTYVPSHLEGGYFLGIGSMVHSIRVVSNQKENDVSPLYLLVVVSRKLVTSSCTIG